jgi:hypothetical protein
MLGVLLARVCRFDIRKKQKKAEKSRKKQKKAEKRKKNCT